MALTIELRPFERVLIGTTMLQNGPTRWRFAVETKAGKILRGRELMQEHEADTPAKRVYYVVLSAYLADEPADVEAQFLPRAKELAAADPDTKSLISEILSQLVSSDYYGALKAAKKLLQEKGPDGSLQQSARAPEVPSESWQPRSRPTWTRETLVRRGVHTRSGRS